MRSLFLLKRGTPGTRFQEKKDVKVLGVDFLKGREIARSEVLSWCLLFILFFSPSIRLMLVSNCRDVLLAPAKFFVANIFFSCFTGTRVGGHSSLALHEGSPEPSYRILEF